MPVSSEEFDSVDFKAVQDPSAPDSYLSLYGNYGLA